MFTKFRLHSARFVAIAGFTLMSATVASAQERIPTGAGNAFGNLQVTEPRGEFARNTGNGFGLGAGLVFRLDPNAIINWRTEASVVTYGRSERKVPFPGTGGLISLELETTSSIFSFVTGPQLLGPKGVFMPYIAPLGGFSVFWTQSSLEGSDNEEEPFASTTNSTDAVWAYGAAAGTYLRVYNGKHPVRVELGARLLRHDNVKYLNSERIREAFENDTKPVPIRGRADFVTYYAGVSVVIF